LTYDNYSAHLIDEVKDKVAELGFTLVELPPNSTWAIQPLDVAINRPVKEGVRGAYRDEYVRRHKDPATKGTWKVSHNWIVTTTQQQYRLAATREHVDNAFRTCGLCAGRDDCSDMTRDNTYWLRLRSLQSSLAKFGKELAAEHKKASEKSLFVDCQDYAPTPDIILSVSATPDSPADERVEMPRFPLGNLDNNIPPFSESFEESLLHDVLCEQLLTDDFVRQFV
jgi:hypothetical protein